MSYAFLVSPCLYVDAFLVSPSLFLSFLVYDSPSLFFPCLDLSFLVYDNYCPCLPGAYHHLVSRMQMQVVKILVLYLIRKDLSTTVPVVYTKLQNATHGC